MKPSPAAAAGDKWFLDEVFIRIQGIQHYLWRAVDQGGVVLHILCKTRRDAKAAKRFFKRLLKGLQYRPRVIITDKLRSYGVAQRQLLPDVEDRQSRGCRCARLARSAVLLWRPWLPIMLPAPTDDADHRARLSLIPARVARKHLTINLVHLAKLGNFRCPLTLHLRSLLFASGLEGRVRHLHGGFIRTELRYT
jgi:hypothetical protein